MNKNAYLFNYQSYAVFFTQNLACIKQLLRTLIKFLQQIKIEQVFFRKSQMENLMACIQICHFMKS